MVALQLHLGRGRLQQLCLWDAGDFVIGAFNPVAPKLGQQDQGEGPFSAQDLKEHSAEGHSPCTSVGALGHPPQLGPGATSVMAEGYQGIAWSLRGSPGSHPGPPPTYLVGQKVCSGFYRRWDGKNPKELFCQTSIKMLVSQVRKLRGRDINNLPQASWLESGGWNPRRLAQES